MNVADVMTSPARCVRAQDSLEQASRLMWDHDIGSVPVVDAQGRAIAMVTDRDICMAVYTRGKRVAELSVQDAMSRAVYTCHREDKLGAAERTMRVHQVRRLPVVDDAGQLVGVLSLNDIARARANSPLAHAMESVLTDVIITLAAVGQPRGAALVPEKQVAALDPFEVHDLPTYREQPPPQPTSRVPPPGIRDPASLFRF